MDQVDLDGDDWSLTMVRVGEEADNGQGGPGW